MIRRTLTFALAGLGRTLERLAEASFYAAAGTLRSHEIETAITRFWERFGASDAHIAGGLMKWEREFYLRFLEPEDRLLLVGSGTGRDLVALLKLGFRADGIDLAEHATAVAASALAREGLRAELRSGSIETITLRGTYDGIVFSWFCYGYIPETSRRTRILLRLAEHLAPDGRILISYNPRDRHPSRLATRAAQMAARLVGSDWRPVAGDVIFFARDTEALQYEHRFEAGELEAEARAAGLVILFDARVPEGVAALGHDPARRCAPGSERARSDAD